MERTISFFSKFCCSVYRAFQENDPKFENVVDAHINWSPDSKWFIRRHCNIANNVVFVYVHNAEDGSVTHRFTSPSIYSGLEWAPDSSCFAIDAVDTASKPCLCFFQHGHVQCTDVVLDDLDNPVWSPDSQFYLCSTDLAAQRAILWDRGNSQSFSVPIITDIIKRTSLFACPKWISKTHLWVNHHMCTVEYGENGRVTQIVRNYKYTSGFSQWSLVGNRAVQRKNNTYTFFQITPEGDLMPLPRTFVSSVAINENFMNVAFQLTTDNKLFVFKTKSWTSNDNNEAIQMVDINAANTTLYTEAFSQMALSPNGKTFASVHSENHTTGTILLYCWSVKEWSDRTHARRTSRSFKVLIFNLMCVRERLQCESNPRLPKIPMAAWLGIFEALYFLQ